MSKQQDAEDCLSLAYKYVCLSDCVQSQRPSLLSDSILSNLLAQKEVVEILFEKRVRELAYEDV